MKIGIPKVMKNQKLRQKDVSHLVCCDPYCMDFFLHLLEAIVDLLPKTMNLLGRSVDQNLDRVWQEAWFSKSCRSWARAVAILLTAMFFVVVLSHSQSQNFAKRPKSLTESLKA